MPPSTYTLEDFPKPSTLTKNYSNALNGLKKPEYYGAEQKSIEKVMEKKNLNPADCYYHFLLTNTPDCQFCGSFIGHEVIQGGQVTFYIPAGLGKADDDNFAKQGIPSLLSCIAEILDKIEKDNHEAVIIPTGGYKAIIPYLTIASVLYKQPAYYIYEESEALLELPAPPLSINGPEFRSALVLMENITGSDKTNADSYFQELPESFQKLLYINKDNHTYEYNGFGQRLKKMFLDQPSSALKIRASGNTLIRKLGKYRDIFLEMTALGDTVWLGDKAPEMADHAKYHHVNLLAYGELLLLPLFDKEPDFLSEGELFLLLSMIYLHDTGHSLCSLDTSSDRVPLLPTEIRIFHNLLGYHRLRKSGFHSALQRQGLNIQQSLLDNISLLSVYHRKKMPLLKGKCTNPDGTGFKPLCEESISLDGYEITGERLALLVALFRIIDGMDKQVARAGDAIEISMKAESILSDLGHLNDRTGRLDKSLSAIAPSAKKEADKILDEIFKDYKSQEKVTSNDKQTVTRSLCTGADQCGFECRSPEDKPEDPCYLKLKKSLYNNNDLSETNREVFLHLAWEYLDARTRFFFQSLQPTYYYSDLLLSMPRITHSVKNGSQHILVNYDENPDISSMDRIKGVWEQIKLWIKNNIAEKAPERNVLNAKLDEAVDIVEGIRDEYCSKKNSEVAEILNRNNIVLEFQYKNNPVHCWKDNSD